MSRLAAQNTEAGFADSGFEAKSEAELAKRGLTKNHWRAAAKPQRKIASSKPRTHSKPLADAPANLKLSPEVPLWASSRKKRSLSQAIDL